MNPYFDNVKSQTSIPLLQVIRLATDYGDTPIFQGVDFKLFTGRHTALLGPSGCGKSSLLRLVCGLEVPSEGEIYIEGKIASDAKRVVLPPHHREIGMVFQELALWPHLSAFENVLLGMPRDFLDQKERLNAARDALGVCRLDGLENRRPSELSVGQQQRVALARALAPRPKLLLLDEPFTGLDVTLKVEIFSQIRQLVELFDLTMLLVTHDPWEAQALVSDALVLEDGSIREQGVLSELLSEPVSRTLRAFVDVGSCCRDGVL